VEEFYDMFSRLTLYQRLTSISRVAFTNDKNKHLICV